MATPAQLETAVYWDFSLRRDKPVSLIAGNPEGAPVRINEDIRKSVLFIGGRDRNGDFVPFGTAFLIADPIPNSNKSVGYIVTANHVLEDIRSSGMKAVVRVNAKDGIAKIASIDIDKWYIHPDIPTVDVAVTPVNISPDTFDVVYQNAVSDVLSAQYIEDNEIGCGDEVHVAGLLTRHFGKTKNVPIIRTGNIAAMPGEPVDIGERFGTHEVFLIESRSIGGLSGSPVFLATPVFRVLQNETVHTGGHKWEYLMGINIGLFETMAHADRIPGEPLQKREAFLELMSAGIAVVVPFQRVTEILERKELVERKARISERVVRETNGFVPTSARGDAAVTVVSGETSDNPAHKEDFTSLLGRAAKASKPSDQT